MGVLLFQLVGLTLLLDPAATPPPPVRPITEADVYQEMGKFFALMGKQQSVLVSMGAGYVRDGFASIDLSYWHRGWRGLRELLPTTIGASLWGSPGGDPVAVTASLGYTLVLGLFEGPYVTANALGHYAPATSTFDAGFEMGLGYEWRPSLGWSLTADVRFVDLWTIGDTTRERDPWGGRFTVGLRRYLEL